ncbi:MAG: cysteine desulfurase family protein [Candidatus Paceibacterota bacterium]
MNILHWLLKPKRIYLDHAAATPVRPEVYRAMRPYFNESFANPSSIHKEGVRARTAVEGARTSVARTLGVRPSDTTFTSGGTESNNLALHGFVRSCHRGGMKYSDIGIISNKAEHPSVLQTLAELESRGCTVTYVPLEEDGRINPQTLKAHLTPTTRLATFAYANSETGVVQDLAKLTRIIQEYAREHGTEVLVHTDASQVPLWLPCGLERLRVDMMTLDAGKFCGPKGVGVLVHRGHTTLAPVTFGGSQEQGLRPGTENVPGVVGAAAALAIAQNGSEARSQQVRTVRDYGIEVLTGIEGVVLNGSVEQRLPNNINISIPGLDTEYATVVLDANGIAASTKSACSGAGGGMSTVVFEMTKDSARASATLRLTLGEETTRKDMDRVREILAAHIHKMLIYRGIK